MRIIKLGGSLITYKSSDGKPPYRSDETSIKYRVREDRLIQVSKALRPYLSEGMILIHGGGTHGHRTVSRWKKGFVRGSERMSVWEVKWRMEQLTCDLLRVMGKNKLPLVAVSPSDIATLKGGRLAGFDHSVISGIIQRECIPVLRGDLVPEVEGSWSVLSGDEIGIGIAEASVKGSLPRTTQTVMCMDVEGFYSRGPNGDRMLLEEIGPDDLHEHWRSWGQGVDGTAGVSDVSGGIMGKVLACHRIAALGIEARMVGGDLGINLRKVFSGEKAGTKFTPFAGGKPCRDGTCILER